MAQHDYTIANQSGAAFRSDLNNGLAAIVSQNSGAAQPSTTYAYQWWADTTTGLLKLRNAANNAWITIGTLADANLGMVSRSGGFILNQGGPSFLEIGTGTNTSQSAYLDLVGDTTYTDYGLRLFRGAGANAGSNVAHKGTGPLSFITEEAAPLIFATANIDRGRVDPSGRFLIGTNTASGSALLQVAGDAQITSLNGGPLAGFRNLIINGNPTINQRGYVSGTATSGASQYTLDRWRVVTSGQNISWTDSANVRTVTAPAGGVEQVVEGANLFTGTYTLNWTGTATATVGGTAVAKGGNVTLTGGTVATVRFISGTFSLAQLEPGSVATPFEQRPIGTELALCQRYYEEVDGEFRNDGALGGTNISVGHTWFCTVPKRIAPTVSVLSQSATNASNMSSVTVKSENAAFCVWEYTSGTSIITRNKAAVIKFVAEL